MKYGRTYNFSAGPAMMPEIVLEEIAAEMMNYRGSGMCVMEMSHRSKVFQQIRDEAEADLRKLMGIPGNYKVLFIQGGGTVQFAMVAMNLMKNGGGCYVETGAWSKKAIAEAKKYGEVKIVASSADKNFSYIPDCSNLDIPPPQWSIVHSNGACDTTVGHFDNTVEQFQITVEHLDTIVAHTDTTVGNCNTAFEHVTPQWSTVRTQRSIFPPQ